MLELITTVLIWGFSFALAKKALNLFSPFELVALRLTLGALTAGLLTQIFSVKEEAKDSSSFKKSWGMALTLGFFEFAGTYILYTWSLSYLPSGVVGTLTLLTPTFTFLAGCALKTHRPSFRNFAATLVSFFGACLCFPVLRIFSGVELTHDAIFGFCLLMLSNFFFALGNVLITKWQGSLVWRSSLTVKGLTLGAVLAILVASLTARSPLIPLANWQAWLLPVYLGIVATGLGFWLWNRGVRKVSALPASLVGNFKGPLSVFWGFILLHESFDGKFLFGVVLLLVSTQIISLRPVRRS
jgi:probable blue pigment (indigoidine) exporter